MSCFQRASRRSIRLRAALLPLPHAWAPQLFFSFPREALSSLISNYRGGVDWLRKSLQLCTYVCLSCIYRIYVCVIRIHMLREDLSHKLLCMQTLPVHTNVMCLCINDFFFFSFSKPFPLHFCGTQYSLLFFFQSFWLPSFILCFRDVLQTNIQYKGCQKFISRSCILTHVCRTYTSKLYENFS